MSYLGKVLLPSLGKAVMSGVTGGLTSGIKQRLHNRIGHNQTHPSQPNFGSPAVATPNSLSDNIEAQKDLADHNTRNQMMLETHRANLQKEKPNFIESLGGNLNTLLGLDKDSRQWYESAYQYSLRKPNMQNTTNLDTVTKPTLLPDFSVRKPYRPKGTHGKYRF